MCFLRLTNITSVVYANHTISFLCPASRRLRLYGAHIHTYTQTNMDARNLIRGFREPTGTRPTRALSFIYEPQVK